MTNDTKVKGFPCPLCGGFEYPYCHSTNDTKKVCRHPFKCNCTFPDADIKNNFLQVGRMFECIHCCPDKGYASLPKGMKCECKCHDSPDTTLEGILKEKDVKRFWSKIDKTDISNSCWNWTGSKNTKGYGQLNVKGKNYMAHRISLLMEGIKIPKGMYVDHQCKNHSCVNPQHLKIVTPKENAIYNSNNFSAVNAKKTHCPNGHPLEGDNLFVFKKKDRSYRACATCHREYNRVWKRGHKVGFEKGYSLGKEVGNKEGDWNAEKLDEAYTLGIKKGRQAEREEWEKKIEERKLNHDVFYNKINATDALSSLTKKEHPVVKMVDKIAEAVNKPKK